VSLWCSHAWVAGRWQADVLLQVDDHGFWQSVQPGAPAAQAGDAQRLGPCLPGLVDAHSHAFQRAMAALAERMDPQAPADDFWSWRERMCRVAGRMDPQALETVATWLYTELLAQGYTHVCEFHYLHHAPDGRPHADPQALGWALVRAAERSGMGLTLLPTLYMRAGFDGAPLQPAQARFAGTPEFIVDSRDRVLAQARQRQRQALLHAGLAAHSLRAVPPAALRELAQAAGDGPLHIHVAEQEREVQQCLAEHGLRPVQWLLQHMDLGPRWQLVHATHLDVAELAGLARSGAGVVLCPSTEANLGDGLWPLPQALEAGLPWSIGSDSQVGRSWRGELRCLEYGQRLARRQRNIAARHGGRASSAQVLFEQALQGGSRASGLPLGGIAPGQRADLQELDTAHPALCGLPVDSLLDACVFSEPSPPLRRVWVAGRPVTCDFSALAGPWQTLLAELWPGARPA